MRDVHPRIVVPTLLLYGDADVRAPLQVGEDLHAAIPGSRLVVMPAAGFAQDHARTIARNHIIRAVRRLRGPLPRAEGPRPVPTCR